MPNRMDTSFTSEHFVAFCQAMIGQPYWYGTCVFKCTQKRLNAKKKQYPAHYAASRMNRYREDIARREVCADCAGLIKGYCWTDGGVGVIASIGTDKTFVNEYGSHGCPDKSADGLFAYAREKGCAWGPIDTLPEIPGLALCREGHVGVYAGSGWAVEERGFAYGCVKTKVAERGWTAWYQLPFIDYGDVDFAAAPGAGSADDPPSLGSRTLRKGSRGADVRALQELLMKLGYPLPRWGADGVFGEETAEALAAFQKQAGLRADGVCGPETRRALIAAADADSGGASPGPEGRRVVIACGSGAVNIRLGNGTQYGCIASAKNGAAFPWVATASNGWHAVALGEQVGWVSGRFSSVQ